MHKRIKDKDCKYRYSEVRDRNPTGKKDLDPTVLKNRCLLRKHNDKSCLFQDKNHDNCILVKQKGGGSRKRNTVTEEE